MTATTTASTTTPSYLSHRFSNSMLSASRLGQSSQSYTYLSTSASSNLRDNATPSNAVTMSSLHAHQPTDYASPLPSPSRRSSRGDASIHLSATTVKYACASCIRGHRTSTCTHKDGSKGPLYPIRSKGRPPTQCEICRQRRKESGRHVRCDCSGKKPSTASCATTSAASQPINKVSPAFSTAPVPIMPAGATSLNETIDRLDHPRPTKKLKTQQEPRSKESALSTPERRFSDAESIDQAPSAFDNVLAPIRTSRNHHSWSLPSIHCARRSSQSLEARVPAPQSFDEPMPVRYSTLSLSSLMNPCDCRNTGSCTCCSDQHQRNAPVSPKQRDAALGHCDPRSCSCSGPSCPQAKGAALTHEQHSVSASQDHVSSKMTASAGCCSSKDPSASSAPSIELLLQAVDMSTEFVPPPCGCGDNCRCARCLSRSDAAAACSSSITTTTTTNVRQHTAADRASSTITASSNASPRTPPATLPTLSTCTPTATGADAGCDDCAACDLALERPSGIGAVDSWMEKHSRHRSPSTESRTVASGSTSRTSSRAEQASAVFAPTSVPTLHGGLLTSEPSQNQQMVEGDDEVRAELVLIHPKCADCLQVVRNKGVGVLSAAPSVNTK
ncbi:uncharacterized protein MEPE_03102 [Melanopsichium pennsylvanicum]|uniref:Copper-fist domain-containing protein n=2 Tax=Melanopsichium pennsylvanicum TaxID=63383 RepID=A0AAJ4XLL2_9BASI|nr:putative protein [Melanopsichium pennsylvanicum 4]SNX84393.1 uncharacterized protein MEPE_03102 [Melanopsichium pennsylvanicum]